MTASAEELEESSSDQGADELPRMTLIEHLDELRRRLAFCVISIFIAFLGCWYASPLICSWLSRPIDRYLPEGTTLAFTALADPFMLYVKVALLAAVFAVSPVLLGQLWLFLKPGLYRRERRLAIPFIIFTSLFFLAGGLLGYEIAFPMVVRFLLGVGEQFQPVQPTHGLGECLLHKNPHRQAVHKATRRLLADRLVGESSSPQPGEHCGGGLSKPRRDIEQSRNRVADHR